LKPPITRCFDTTIFSFYLFSHLHATDARSRLAGLPSPYFPPRSSLHPNSCVVVISFFLIVRLGPCLHVCTRHRSVRASFFLRREFCVHVVVQFHFFGLTFSTHFEFLPSSHFFLDLCFANSFLVITFTWDLFTFGMHTSLVCCSLLFSPPHVWFFYDLWGLVLEFFFHI